VRVALTRAAGGNDALAARLDGFELVDCPLISIEWLDGPPLRLDGADWLVLTSRHGVDALFARLDGGLPRVAVVGPGTAEALRTHGVEPDLVAEVSTQEGLVAAFPPEPGRVVFAGAEDARDIIVRELGAEFVPLYRTVALASELPDVDLVVLASASAARVYAALGGGTPVVSIGPVTSAAARDAGLEVVAEAETHDVDGLARAVRLAASQRPSSPS
jgi:uroporphyrinogen III methyltransferase/synthase